MSVHRFAHEAMATVFEVRCDHPDSLYAGQAARAAFDLVDRLEQDLSRFRANSDVSRIGQLGARGSTRVSPATMECLEAAWRLHELTRGAFDVSLGAGIDGLDLEPDELTVHARKGGVSLALGGIGKGYAVDRVAELLEEWEVRRALVHGGFSSVRALEPPTDAEGWPLTLSAPGTARVLARVSACRRAFSASGTQKGDHILDPRSGRPAPKRVTWVAVPCLGAGTSPATLAEGLSTAFMVLPTPEIEELCGRCPGVEAWLVPEPTGPSGAEPTLVHFPAAGPVAG